MQSSSKLTSYQGLDSYYIVQSDTSDVITSSDYILRTFCDETDIDCDIGFNVSVGTATMGLSEYWPPENCLLWKYPAMKVSPSENCPQENCPRKLTPRKLSPMKAATTAVRNWKLLPCSPYVVMKNKAWWGVWWSWVSWKYRYLLNFTWIVVFF